MRTTCSRRIAQHMRARSRESCEIIQPLKFRSGQMHGAGEIQHRRLRRFIRYLLRGLYDGTNGYTEGSYGMAFRASDSIDELRNGRISAFNLSFCDTHASSRDMTSPPHITPEISFSLEARVIKNIAGADGPFPEKYLNKLLRTRIIFCGTLIID